MKNDKFALGVDLGGTSVKVGIVTNSGKIVKKKSLPTKAAKGPDAVVHQIIKCIKLAVKNFEHPIEGIGIGSPGAVLTKKGTVENPPNFPGWEKVPLGKIIKKEFKISTYVENDANAAAIGELIYGAGKKMNNFLMITLGTGVGGGLIFNKQIFRGDQGAAGELGHVSININGRKCKCGSKGCIEAYIGNNYIIQDTKRLLRSHPESNLNKLISEDSPLSPKLIFEASQLNDEFAISTINKLGDLLGAFLASMITALDVTNVIIGGGVAGFGDILFNSIRNSTEKRVMQHLKGKIIINPAKLKNNAGIKGASSLVFYNEGVKSK